MGGGGAITIYSTVLFLSTCPALHHFHQTIGIGKILTAGQNGCHKGGVAETEPQRGFKITPSPSSPTNRPGLHRYECPYKVLEHDLKFLMVHVTSRPELDSVDRLPTLNQDFYFLLPSPPAVADLLVLQFLGLSASHGGQEK